MSEEKKVLEEVVAAIKKLLGFGDEEQITAAVNGIVDAKGDETGVVSALQGFFGDAIPQADLLGVVSGFLGKGNGIDLGNILELFQGIGDKVGGFDKIAGLVGMASGAGKVTDAVKATAGSVTGAVAAAAGQATGAAGKVTDAVADAAGAATDAAADAADAAANVATDAASTVTGAVKGAAGAATDALEGAVDSVKQVAAEPAAKRKKKWPIVVGVIAAVAVLAVIGMLVWHEQPSFCGAICHAPMDAYLEGYMQEDNAAGTDKYGNEVTNTHAMLAVSHRSQNLACLDCHEPSIPQQVHEGIMMVTGTYTVVDQVDGTGYGQIERTLSQLRENAGFPNESGKGDEFCLRSGCHDYDRETLAKVQVVEGTIVQPHMWLATPHASSGGMEFACGDCHKSHRASIYVCTACHNENSKIPLDSSSIPDGWLTFQEGNAALVKAAA